MKYAQETGAKIGYIGDFDLHEDPAIMDGYKLFVSQGHDEYWTKEMFDAVENRIFKQGKNTAFLGANTAYWQVRYTDINKAPGGKALSCRVMLDVPLSERREEGCVGWCKGGLGLSLRSVPKEIFC